MSDNDFKEVIFVKAKLDVDGSPDQYKKFAIDPSITNYDVLLRLLSKCFNIDSDLSICYLSVDQYGEQLYLPLRSDWDLDASIMTSLNSTLLLKVTYKTKSSDSHDWDIVLPSDCEKSMKRSNHQRSSSKRQSLFTQLSQRWGKTFSNMRKTLANGLKLDDEELSSFAEQPISDLDFKQYMDANGRVDRLNEFYRDVYYRGLEHSVRKVAWRILLSVCPSDTTGAERCALLEVKAHQYATLKESWKNAYASGLMSEQQLATLASISIDVIRTDWKHEYYRSDEQGQRRVGQLFDLLVTYCINHPNIGYNQGMSDLASPLLVVENDEALTYMCFCALMQRVKSKLYLKQHIDLMKNMKQLFDLLIHTDVQLADFLHKHNLSNMFFTQRWFVLELKREFPFYQSLYIFEIQWAALCLLGNSALDCGTSNSKSEGYLVLTDSASQSSNLAYGTKGAENWDVYTIRDVSLINSLIGADYMIHLPEKKLIRSDHMEANLIVFTDNHSTDSNGVICNVTDTSNSNQPSSSTMGPVSDNATAVTTLSNNSSDISSVNQDSNGLHFEQNDDQLDSITSTNNMLINHSSLDNFTATYYDQSVNLYNYLPTLPSPDEIGQGNPFLLFLCLSLILEYKTNIMTEIKDPGELVHFFQQTSCKHNLYSIVIRARKLLNHYLHQIDSRKYNVIIQR